MAPATQRWTVEQVHQLPNDGNRYEVIDGRLFANPPPSYTHQRAVRELLVLLHAYLVAEPIGAVIPAPAGVDVDARTEVEPDLFVVPLVKGKEPGSFAEAERLLLVIEVLSPSSLRTDRQEKRALYAKLGVPEYWIVDLEAKAVERWRLGAGSGEKLRDRIEWRPDPGKPAFVVHLPELFARVG